jgi:serine/threonine protein kinase
MPHKGYSIRDIGKDPAMLAKIIALPLEVKVREIYKLMNILKALGDAGYVHGDLREPNILINPDTGTMNMIDFDLLKPTSVFGATFPSPYYHIPPEAAYLLTYKEPVSVPASGPPAPSFWEDFLERFVNKGEDPKALMYGELFGNPAYYYDGVKEFHYPAFHEESLAYATSFCDSLRGKTSDEVERLRKHADKLMSTTVDSFSLAYCLRYLFNRLILSGADDKLKKFLLEDLFPKMTNGNAAARLQIEAAMGEFKEFAKRSFGITLDPPTAAAAVDAVEAEAPRLEGLAAAAAPARLSDAEIIREFREHFDSMGSARGVEKENIAATEMINFTRLNAIPFLEKHPEFRKVIVGKCNEFFNDRHASAELKEASMALLALIDPASAAPAAAAAAASPPKSKSRSAAAAAPAAPDSARTLGSLRLSPASSTKSKKGGAAAAAIGELAAAAAAAAAAVAPVARATAAKKLTRTQRRRAQRKLAKTRNQARAQA